MAMNQNDLTVIGGTQIAIGLSQVIRVTAGAFQYSTNMKYLSGGSLEIVPIQLSGSSTAAGGAWTKGYLLGVSEAFSWDGPAAVYLAATNATCIVQFAQAYTSGATCL